MCYKDAADVVLTFDCPIENAYFLDCGHDDYFHTSPPAGTYLDNHWNVADSSFLHRGPIGDPPPPPPNEAPTVDAGSDMAVMITEAAALNGSAEDDGMPTGALTIAWAKASGPGEVTFADPAAAATSVTFSAAGVYVLELTADDGEMATTDPVTVTVEEEAPPPPTEVTDVFEASLNKRNPGRSHEVESGEGTATATLTFANRGKKRTAGELTLTAFDAAGNQIAAATGGSPVTIQMSLLEGVYRFEVSGTRTSYVLEVTHMAI
jgi:hypothetical protein